MFHLRLYLGHIGDNGNHRYVLVQYVIIVMYVQLCIVQYMYACL